MEQPESEQLMTVMLQDLIHQSLPRTFAIRQKLEKGEVLLGSEIEFLVEMLDRFKLCERNFMYDAQCKVIFKTVSHLLYEVANMAMHNEESDKQA